MIKSIKSRSTSLNDIAQVPFHNSITLACRVCGIDFDDDQYQLPPDRKSMLWSAHFLQNVRAESPEIRRRKMAALEVKLRRCISG